MNYFFIVLLIEFFFKSYKDKDCIIVIDQIDRIRSIVINYELKWNIKIVSLECTAAMNNAPMAYSTDKRQNRF